MKTIKQKSLLPGAWIVNPKDRGRKSIVKGNIYLKDGDEFEIEIFNPLETPVLADIRINGESISKNGLVIKPGQRNYLDCFIDTKRKFKFETYNVEETKEVKEAISNNGLLEIFFYKEDVIKFNNWQDRYRRTVIKEYYPVYIDRNWWYYPYNGCFGGNLNGSFGGSFGGNSIGTLYSSSNINCSVDSSQSSFATNLSNSFENKTLETGRIEQGEESNQKFDNVYMNFEENYIHSIIYNLLPESRKPVEVKKKKKIFNENTDLLLKLSELKEAGILTEKEFSDKKKEILSRI